MVIAWAPTSLRAAESRESSEPKTLEQRINAHRKTDVRIIVLNAAGKAAAHAKVHLRQLKHEFELGVVLPKRGWPADEKRGEAFEGMGGGEVLRAFSAVSLARHTGWSALEPKAGQRSAPSGIEKLLNQAHRRGLRVRWGRLISADEAYNPDWLAPWSGEQLQTALERHVRQTVSRFGDRGRSFDLYTDVLSHHLVEDRLGMAMVRRLFQRVHAFAPDATRCLRISSALNRREGVKAVRKVIGFKQAQIPFDRLAINQTFDGEVDPKTLNLALERLETLDSPLVISSLEVAGPNPMQAALNLETVLRRLFAEPRIRGIYFQGLRSEDFAHRQSALLDQAGNPTAAGRTLDRLFYKRWRTDRTVRTNRAGEITTRLFAGTYQITAELGHGRTTSTQVVFALANPAANAEGSEESIDPVVIEPVAEYHGSSDR